jgi:hypothetical protein
MPLRSTSSTSSSVSAKLYALVLDVGQYGSQQQHRALILRLARSIEVGLQFVA